MLPLLESPTVPALMDSSTFLAGYGMATLPMFWPAVALTVAGLAFYTWDYGVKRGRLQTLAALAYLVPLLSTLLLVALGLAEPTWVIAAAGVLIAGGAFLAGRPIRD